MAQSIWTHQEPPVLVFSGLKPLDPFGPIPSRSTSFWGETGLLLSVAFPPFCEQQRSAVVWTYCVLSHVVTMITELFLSFLSDFDYYV